MRFAELAGERIEAAPSLRANCPACSTRVIAKCGTVKVRHWAHLARLHCDSWWEPETAWHRDWKSLFPVENQEVIQTDPTNGEKHIADVKTAKGMVIEFQNSAISETEVRSRERFYKRMIWIVNAACFVDDFTFLSELPDPTTEFGKRFARSVGLSPGGSGFRSVFPNTDSWTGNDLKNEIKRHFAGHYLYKWKRQRGRWLGATKDVFLDFGNEDLWWLRKYNALALRCVKRIKKNELLEKNGGRIPNKLWPMRSLVGGPQGGP